MRADSACLLVCLPSACLPAQCVDRPIQMWELSLQSSCLTAVQASPGSGMLLRLRRPLSYSQASCSSSSSLSLGRRIVPVGCAGRKSKSEPKSSSSWDSDSNSNRSHVNPFTPWVVSSAALAFLLSSSDLALAASYLLKTPTTPLASTGEIALRRAVPPSSQATAQVGRMYVYVTFRETERKGISGRV